MAEEKSEEKTEKKAEEKKKTPRDPSSLKTLLVLLNTVALLGVLGLALYTKVLYKKPKIGEMQARAEIKKEQKKIQTQLNQTRALFRLDPIEANLKPTQIGPSVPGAPPPQFKPHFIQMTVDVEITDASFGEKIKGVLPKFNDQLLYDLGETTVEELSTVQGRFILRSKISGMLNELLNEPTPVVTAVYFSDFIVQ